MPRHVIFIGETGSGKSSIINLIADRNLAETSLDAKPCTHKFASYDVLIEGRTYTLWDTPGLGEPSRTSSLWCLPSRRVSKSVEEFLEEKRRRRELDLLVFCVHHSRATNAMSKAYQTFCDATHRTFPVVIAITRLERQEPNMDAWWNTNERELTRQGFSFDGHVCVTSSCLPAHRKRRRISQERIRLLISEE